MIRYAIIFLILSGLLFSLLTADGEKNNQGQTSESLVEGVQAPTFVLPDMNNNYVFLSDFCGEKLRKPYKNNIRHVVVVSFFASWCVPCRAEIPHLNNLYQELKNEDIKFYLVNVGEDKEKVNEFLQQVPSDIPILIDRYKSVSDKFNVTSLPRLVVIDKFGAIRKYEVGFNEEPEYEFKLKNLLIELLNI